jgi:Ca2+/H+ antiporter, TMEM165/GDT1 family
MEALLPVILAVLMGEMGGKVQGEAEALMRGHGSALAIVLALGLTSLTVLFFAAFAGILLAEMMTYQARTLMLGVALLSSAFGLFWRKKDAAPVGKKQPFVTSVWRLISAQLSDNSGFLVFAFAARTHAPVLAASAGFCGMVLAVIPVLAAPDDWRADFKVALLRKIFGFLFLFVGLGSVLTALQLIF